MVFVAGVVSNRGPSAVPITGPAGLIYLPGILACISLFMVNTVVKQHLEDDGVGPKLKVWLFFATIIGFSAGAVAIWVLITQYLNNPGGVTSPGIGAVVQTFCILIR